MRSWMFRNAAIGILVAWPVAALATPSYTAIILGPADSMARGIGGGQIAGIEGSTPVVWDLADQSVAGLDSTDFPGAWAIATDGINQVGTDAYHALLWGGPGSSAIDLTPAGSTHSFAGALYGQWQGGGVSGPATNYLTNAALWQGSASSFQNLNPAGYTASEIVAMTQSRQVTRRVICEMLESRKS